MATTGQLGLTLLEAGDQNAYALYNENLIITELIAVGLFESFVTSLADATDINKMYILDQVSDNDHNKAIIKLSATTARVILLPTWTRLTLATNGTIYTYNGTAWV
jgi:hypothetical protein